MSNEKMAIVVERTGNIRTPKGRLSYAYLDEPNPKSKTKDGKLKYTTSLLIPPGSDLTAMVNAAKEAVTTEWGSPPKDKKGIAFKPKSPFLDAAEKMGEEWKGWTLIRLSSVRKPGGLMADAKTSPEPQDIYSGRWAFLTCHAGTYDKDGNRGVSFYLDNYQLLDHDEPLSGRAKVTDDFEPVTDDAAVGAAASAAELFG